MRKDSDGLVGVRHKSRLAMKGYFQTTEIDCDEVHFATTKSNRKRDTGREQPVIP